MGLRSSGFTPRMVSDFTTKSAPTAGATVVIPFMQVADVFVRLTPAGLLATLTVQLPTGAFDGQTVTLMCSQVVSILSITTTTGTVVGLPLTAVVAGGYAAWVWDGDNLQWVRCG